MTDTTATIAGKGCQGTGITEEIADRIADAEAGTLICIVELSYSALHKKRGGKRKVELVIEHIEPAVDGFADDYLREVQSAMYKNRSLQGHTGTTTGGTEPTVQEVLANGERFKAHPFLPVNAGEDDQPICDVCGLLGTAPIHSTQEVIVDDEDDDQDEPDDVEYLPEDAAEPEADLDPADELDEPDPDEPIVLDNPTASELAYYPHIHKTDGTCIKHRHGTRCEAQERHLAAVSNPFENPGA